MVEAMTVAEESAQGTTLWRDQRPLTRSTIHAEVTGRGRGTVSAAGAAHFLEWGTTAHTITARNGQALRFFVNGVAIFRRSVRHPGTAERPFMRASRERAAIAATGIVVRNVGAVIAGI